MVICKELCFSSLSTQPFSLKNSRPCKYRVLDCQGALDEKVLRIHELDILPQDFAAISYVWKGHPPSTDIPATHLFTISGAEHSDPINTDVLRSACRTAVMNDCRWLWLDRVCIMQTSREDKNWQIVHMSDIFKNCRLCIVLAGGLSRLSTPFEETSWTSRAWTLQEALLPSTVLCLFAWERGSQHFQKNIPVRITEVDEGRSATMLLSEALYAARVRFNFANNESVSIPAEEHCLRMLGNHTMVLYLDDARFQNSVTYGLGGSRHSVHYALLRCAFIRTSSRPVDMVLSIMGLFDVKLNPASYGANDRSAATRDLLRQLLANGARADWLGLQWIGYPSPDISYLPPMPVSNEGGAAFIVTPDGATQTAESYPFPAYRGLVEAPGGKITPEGLFEVLAPAARVAHLITLELEIPERLRCKLSESGFLVAKHGQVAHINNNSGTWSLVSAPKSESTHIWKTFRSHKFGDLAADGVKRGLADFFAIIEGINQDRESKDLAEVAGLMEEMKMNTQGVDNTRSGKNELCKSVAPGEFYQEIEAWALQVGHWQHLGSGAYPAVSQRNPDAFILVAHQKDSGQNVWTKVGCGNFNRLLDSPWTEKSFLLN
ncbi:hypothetical protein N7493_009433 [Penicillium malachiteum]|uniref:Heterokaryon incompatibility domain-containing protein n=1 Tax=Penicillium malachiteum TaxID=1324776 RepID=A0AAD6HE50_9EURO|nr:hypothetical protein N7493_009433 [Penicillium malachiteum]